MREKKRLEKHLRAHGVSYDLIVTESEENLKDLTRKLTGKYGTIVGAGGDSTFSVMINEIIRERAEVNFGMIGLGSSNDITKEFGLDSPGKACLAIKKGRVRKVDVGCIFQEQAVLSYFLGQANIGLGVYVNKYVAELALKKPGLAQKQSLAGMMGIVHAYRAQEIPLPLTVECEVARFEGRFVLAVFSNLRYWATGRMICPDSLPDDGLLDCCLFRECSLPRLGQLAFLARRGRHLGAKEVEICRALRFEISSDKPFSIQVDGEILCSQDRPTKFRTIHLAVIPQALRVIRP